MPLSDEQERREAVGEQLRAKIASKFTASTFFAGFALAVLASQVFAVWEVPKFPVLFPAALGLLLMAVMLFVEAVLRLDELTMPKAFWRVPGADPATVSVNHGLLTQDDLVNLHRRMVFLWYALSVVAMFITAAAVLLMLVPWELWGGSDAKAESIWFALIGLVVGTIYCLVTRAVAKSRYPELLTRVD